MDFVWLFPLILLFLSNGQSYTEVTGGDACYSSCPRGYHKAGDCKTPAATFRCEKCLNGITFTARNNTSASCLRCDACGHDEMEIKPCSFDSDVVCDCKAGFYNTKPGTTRTDCRRCPINNCNGSDNKMKCTNYQRCLTNSECRRKCVVTASPSTNPSTTHPSATSPTTPSATSPTTGAATGTLNPVMNPIPAVNQILWVLLSGVVVAFLGLLLLLLLCNRETIRHPDRRPCWSVNKHPQSTVADPEFNDQHSHRGDSPTTLTFNISEETPMMNLSPSPGTPEHPAHITRLLPDPEAAKQDEQSEHWPAIALYAIIKEVPLRRWKEFLRLLHVADRQLERVELESGSGVGSMERQYQMLRLWSQRSSAGLNDVLSALHYMDLSGCAQRVQESLEKLQWRPEPRQGFADRGFMGAMQDS